ncbi:SMC-Scp complex subunit ScpB [Oligoflexia bacterium]|nr:SMC-Scp complex subunit ScpB [Oligoflexia bacterium]
MNKDVIEELEDSSAESVAAASEAGPIDADASAEDGAGAPQTDDPEESDDETELDFETAGLDKSGLVEALVFAHNEPIGVARIKQVTGLVEKEVRDILESIMMKFELEDCGFELVSVAGKYQFRTKSVYAPYVRKLKAGLPRKLSAAALETLAIVAYRQPIVKSDIEKIRGVDATPTLKTLLERGLIRIVGHRASVGQPALYGSTDEFLKIFGLQALSELPTLRDLKELDADPGEVAEAVENTETCEAEVEDQELNLESLEAASSEVAAGAPPAV